MSEENNDKKKNSTVDKIVMGAIIGTAIGSAVGVTMAPKKGKELREDIKEQSKEVRQLTKETATGFWSLGKRLLLGKKKKKKQAEPDMRAIPTESEIIPK
jgi:gas vesicle protein